MSAFDWNIVGLMFMLCMFLCVCIGYIIGYSDGNKNNIKKITEMIIKSTKKRGEK